MKMIIKLFLAFLLFYFALYIISINHSNIVKLKDKIDAFIWSGTKACASVSEV